MSKAIVRALVAGCAGLCLGPACGSSASDPMDGGGAGSGGSGTGGTGGTATGGSGGSGTGGTGGTGGVGGPVTDGRPATDAQVQGESRPPSDAAPPTDGGAQGALRAVVVAGTGAPGFSGNGMPATQAMLNGPFAVDWDSAGTMFIAEMYPHRVRKVDRAGVIGPAAGTGMPGFGGDGMPAAMAVLNQPHHLLVAPGDHVLIADTMNFRVRRIDAATGNMGTFAGAGGGSGFGGDGMPAAMARFSGVYCLAFGPARATLYIADLNNRRIRAIDMATGTVSTVAGNGMQGVPQDGGDAKAQPLQDPRAVAADSRGNVYILERNGHSLRVVDAMGKIRTVAGTGMAGPATGDGGDARMATFRSPKHVTCDQNDDVLIADSDNNVVRRYSPRDGKITRVAGTGTMGSGGAGGPATAVQLNKPHGVAVDPAGVIYISDSDNHRVLKLVP